MSTELHFICIERRARANVREPLPPPQLVLVTAGGAVRTATLDEARLLALIADAVSVLDQMRKSRGATQP